MSSSDYSHDYVEDTSLMTYESEIIIDMDSDLFNNLIKDLQLETGDNKRAKNLIAVKKFLQTDKGKLVLKRYKESDKGKATNKKYESSLKAKARKQRYEKKRLARLKEERLQTKLLNQS